MVGQSILLHPRVEEVDMEGEVIAVVVDVRDFEAGFRGAIGEIRMRVGGRAERGATNELAKMGISDGDAFFLLRSDLRPRL